MAGKPAICKGCRGWGEVYRETRILDGDGRVIEPPTPLEAIVCNACGGTGRPPDKPRKGTPPILKDREAVDSSRRASPEAPQDDGEPPSRLEMRV